MVFYLLLRYFVIEHDDESEKDSQEPISQNSPSPNQSIIKESSNLKENLVKLIIYIWQIEDYSNEKINTENINNINDIRKTETNNKQGIGIGENDTDNQDIDKLSKSSGNSNESEDSNKSEKDDNKSQSSSNSSSNNEDNAAIQNVNIEVRKSNVSKESNSSDQSNVDTTNTNSRKTSLKTTKNTFSNAIFELILKNMFLISTVLMYFASLKTINFFHFSKNYS